MIIVDYREVSCTKCKRGFWVPVMGSGPFDCGCTTTVWKGGCIFPNGETESPSAGVERTEDVTTVDVGGYSSGDIPCDNVEG